MSTTAGLERSTEAEALVAAWERSDALFTWLSEAALLERPIPLRQPFLFYLGHLPAFAWNHLGRRTLDFPAFDPDLDVLFERGIDPPDQTAVPDPRAAWPSLARVRGYRERVRETLRSVLDLPEVQDVLPMVVEHELMHHETLLYMLQRLPHSKKRPPALEPRRRGPVVESGASIEIPAGLAVLGADRGGSFRWDNEEPAHLVKVPAFRIDTLPVTNGEFLVFVEADGYHDPALWSPAAWRRITEGGSTLPQFWRWDADLRVVSLFDDVPFEVAEDWPVSVTHAEAAAYAKWAGARLPTEAEFHRAAYGGPEGGERGHPWGETPPTAAHGNFGFRRREPEPVGTHPEGASAFGVQELVGNGWEWTATPFRPFPRFVAMRAYPGYSADFFDEEHYVLKGASWATDDRLVRRSFRNWFRPHYPYVFSKFRCAR